MGARKVVVGAVRTPFSRLDGAMRDIPGVQLGAMVSKEIIKRTGISPDKIEETYYMRWIGPGRRDHTQSPTPSIAQG